MTVVVTGAAGYVGGNLVRGLLEQGRPVKALVYRDTRAVDGLDVELVRVDLRDREGLVQAFRGAEAVYHTAAQMAILDGDFKTAYKVNVEGTRNVLAACRDGGVGRLVHFSSVQALEQEPMDEPLDERRPLVGSQAISPYHRTKAMSQGDVEAAAATDDEHGGVDAVVINLGAVSGPFDFKPSLAGQMMLDLYHGRIPATVDAGISWVDARDVVQGALAAEQRGGRGERYLLAGHYLSLAEFSASVGELTGVRTPRLAMPMWLGFLCAPIMQGYARLRGVPPLFTRESLKVLSLNHRQRYDKAARELDFHPRPVRETLRDTVEWFREAGMFGERRPWWRVV